jgi:hypothetical protein
MNNLYRPELISFMTVSAGPGLPEATTRQDHPEEPITFWCLLFLSRYLTHFGILICIVVEPPYVGVLKPK